MSAAPKVDDDLRRRELAQIHIAKAQLRMAEDTYRALVRNFSKGRTESAGDLDFTERARLLAHLRACGFKAGKPPYRGRPRNMREPQRGAMLGKVEALLADAGRPWSYAHTLARHMFKVDDVSFCNPEQLHKLVAALVIDQQRRAKAAAAAAHSTRSDR